MEGRRLLLHREHVVGGGDEAVGREERAEAAELGDGLGEARDERDVGAVGGGARVGPVRLHALAYN